MHIMSRGGVIKLPYYLLKFAVNAIRQLTWREFHMSSVVAFKNYITSRCVRCGRSVYIGANCRIEGINRYNNKRYCPEIVLANGVSIQQNAHITCANRIFIGEHSAIAANVTITDINHPYLDITVPIEKQDIEVGEVYIEDGSKIYNNAVILPNVHIGKHCVIGANSVVNKDIPDYSVAVGAPARVVKRYCFETGVWRKTDESGDFV